MTGIRQEFLIFIRAALTGNEVFWIYYLLYILRRLIRHTSFFISLEDIFYWIGISFFLFLRMHDTTNGSIRWYFLLGVVVGAFLPWKLTKKHGKKQLHNQKKRDKMKISTKNG